MIRIWLSREGPPPIREQLAAQLLMGIMSGKLAGGSRLPSVREFARRLKIHRNTVSAAYQDLEARGWLEMRAGSGVFVAAGRAEGCSGVDAFVRLWMEQAQAHGYSREELLAALERMDAPAAHPAVVVVDPDVELARILAAEIGEVLGREVPFASLEMSPEGALLLAGEGNAAAVAARHPGAEILKLKLRSVPEMVAGVQRPATPVLIGLVSRSKSVLHWARPLLSALGFPPDRVLQRDPGEAGWAEGLQACGIVAADVVAARAFPQKGPQPVVFRLMSPASLDDLRGLVTG